MDISITRFIVSRRYGLALQLSFSIKQNTFMYCFVPSLAYYSSNLNQSSIQFPELSTKMRWWWSRGWGFIHFIFFLLLIWSQIMMKWKFIYLISIGSDIYHHKWWFYVTRTNYNYYILMASVGGVIGRL